MSPPTSQSPLPSTTTISVLYNHDKCLFHLLLVEESEINSQQDKKPTSVYKNAKSLQTLILRIIYICTKGLFATSIRRYVPTDAMQRLSANT